MNRKTTITLIVLALATAGTRVGAQTLVWSDTTFVIGPTEWYTGRFPEILQSVNGQLIVSENFGSAINDPSATHVPGVHTPPAFGALPDHQTLEMRSDLVSANQNDAVASIGLVWAAPALGSGYQFFKDEDEIGLLKFYNGATSYAWFFYTNQPIKNQNVTLALAFTRAGTNLKITMRVLDKDNSNSVLFERTVTDTPQADPVLPSGAVRGFIGMSDPPGSPWPLLGSPALVELTLTWFNSQQAPNPRAQVIYDNLELWQYQSPPLAIQNAVVLSWPATGGLFVLESADNVNGPWMTAPDPWCRTNAGCTEVSMSAPDSRKFFRLRLGP